MRVRARITIVALLLAAATGAGTAQAAGLPGNSGSFRLTARSTTAASGYAPTFTGNGLLGVRVPAAGQGYAGGNVPAQSELAGFYAKPSTGKASERVQQRANIPTWSTLTFADGGHTFSPSASAGARQGQRLPAVDRSAHRDRHHPRTLDRARRPRHDDHLPGAHQPRARARRAGATDAAPAMVGHRDRHRRDRRHTGHEGRERDAGADAPGRQVVGPGAARGRRHRRGARDRDPGEHRQPAGPERQHHRARAPRPIRARPRASPSGSASP